MAGLFPETSKHWARIALPLNLMPGLGTMVAAGNGQDLRPFAIGLVQFLVFLLLVPLAQVVPYAAGLLAVLLVGGSLTWGVLVYLKAA